MNDKGPLISIVVPTYNEEQDVQRMLEAVLAQRYSRKEIIVVDDSTDRTPEILKQYESRGVRVFRGGHEGGRNGARNLGVRHASGEILVTLNADACPDPDFLERIVPHYQRGVDFLVVSNRVANAEKLFPRFIDAERRKRVNLANDLWTEGFSCRREAALAVGLFTTDSPIPQCSGEDVVFARELSKRFRKGADASIVVPHYVPSTLSDFWANRWSRGWGSPALKYFYLKKSLGQIVFVVLLKTILRTLMVGLVIPHLVFALLISKNSSRGIKDFLPFVVASGVELLAVTSGEWLGIVAVWQKRNWKSSRKGSKE